MSDAPHIPVMLDEVVEAAAPGPGRTVVDATFGAGGYSRAFLQAGAEVVAFDRDVNARRFAAPLAAANDDRFALIERPFSELERGLGEAGGRPADAIVFDLGVSSMQLDQAERGFSFMRDGPLDMRMGAEGPTAADLVNTAEQAELARILWVYGEERQSRRIAAALVRRRSEQLFERTLDLAEVVERTLGGRRGAPTHPATRTFQALRIAVNDELGELEAGLAASERVLGEGGRLVVVSFHSLEDRLVKSFLTERAGRTPSGSRHLPLAPAGAPPSFKLLFNGARGPSAAEAAANPRARSAKLRAAVRTAARLEGRRMISPARLFNLRYRGFRVVDIACLAVLAALVLGVYGFKAFAGREGAEIAGIDKQIGEQEHEIRLLKAELAHLEQPTRMVRLSTDYLGLEPISAKRESAPEGLTQIALNPAPAKPGAPSASKTAAVPTTAPSTGAAATPLPTSAAHAPTQPNGAPPAGSDPQ